MTVDEIKALRERAQDLVRLRSDGFQKTFHTISLAPTELLALLTIAERAEGLRMALEPFAKIKPSSLHSDADDEMYGVYLTNRRDECDFRRSALIRARAALAAFGETKP